MSKLIKIVQSPFNPPLEVFDDIVIKLHVPISDNSVTVQINPNIQEYKENVGSQVRQVVMTTPTDETKILTFDIRNQTKHKTNVGGSFYEIELLNIGKKNIQNQDFPFYEFKISKV